MAGGKPFHIIKSIRIQKKRDLVRYSELQKFQGENKSHDLIGSFVAPVFCGGVNDPVDLMSLENILRCGFIRVIAGHAGEKFHDPPRIGRTPFQDDHI